MRRNVRYAINPLSPIFDRVQMARNSDDLDFLKDRKKVSLDWQTGGEYKSKETSNSEGSIDSLAARHQERAERFMRSF